MVLHNSQLLAGYMDKANLGSGSKSNIFFAVLKEYGEEETASALSRLTRVATHFMSMLGDGDCLLFYHKRLRITLSSARDAFMMFGGGFGCNHDSYSDVLLSVR